MNFDGPLTDAFIRLYLLSSILLTVAWIASAVGLMFVIVVECAREWQARRRHEWRRP